MWRREKNSNYLGISPGFVSHGEVGKVIPRGREAEQSEIGTGAMNECGHSETQGKYACLLSTPLSMATSLCGSSPSWLAQGCAPREAPDVSKAKGQLKCGEKCQCQGAVMDHTSIPALQIAVVSLRPTSITQGELVQPGPERWLCQ